MIWLLLVTTAAYELCSSFLSFCSVCFLFLEELYSLFCASMGGQIGQMTR